MEDLAGYVLSRRIDRHILGDAALVVWEARRLMFLEPSAPVLNRMHELSRMMMSHLYGGIRIND